MGHIFVCLQLREHGLPGMVGVHAQKRVVQERKVGQEILLTECPALAVQMMHKLAKVSVFLTQQRTLYQDNEQF